MVINLTHSILPFLVLFILFFNNLYPWISQLLMLSDNLTQFPVFSIHFYHWISNFVNTLWQSQPVSRSFISTYTLFSNHFYHWISNYFELSINLNQFRRLSNLYINFFLTISITEYQPFQHYRTIAISFQVIRSTYNIYYINFTILFATNCLKIIRHHHTVFINNFHLWPRDRGDQCGWEEFLCV